MSLRQQSAEESSERRLIASTHFAEVCVCVCVRTDKAGALGRPDGVGELGQESCDVKSMVLTLHSEDHALADVGTHAVGRLAEVEAAVFFQDVSDEQ